jgi:rhodanese-related sulfurtransferase
MPGAINVPYENLGEVEQILGELPDDKWIICHCGGPPCDLGELLGLELLMQGAAHVAVYSGGLDAWRESGGEISRNDE